MNPTGALRLFAADLSLEKSAERLFATEPVRRNDTELADLVWPAGVLEATGALGTTGAGFSSDFRCFGLHMRLKTDIGAWGEGKR